jgi:hypothetical protein
VRLTHSLGSWQRAMRAAKANLFNRAAGGCLLVLSPSQTNTLGSRQQQQHTHLSRALRSRPGLCSSAPKPWLVVQLHQVLCVVSQRGQLCQGQWSNFTKCSLGCGATPRHSCRLGQVLQHRPGRHMLPLYQTNTGCWPAKPQPCLAAGLCATLSSTFPPTLPSLPLLLLSAAVLPDAGHCRVGGTCTEQPPTEP